MIRINLLDGFAPTSHNKAPPKLSDTNTDFRVVSLYPACPDSRTKQLFTNAASFVAVKPCAPMTPELRERLMGKSPLRMIAERTSLHKNVWKEKLECGHELVTFADFYWDEKSHLINLQPTAKRRRCQECKEIALALPPRKPVSPVSNQEKKESA